VIHLELPQRKTLRLKNYDYSSNGAYFITISVKDGRALLGSIADADSAAVRRDAPGTPLIKLSEFGKIVQKNIDAIESHYKNVFIDKYIIMPNHVHIIIVVTNPNINGVPGSSRRTNSDSEPRPTALIPNIIASFKKFSTKEIKRNIWHTSYYDHIIRNYEDYIRVWNYIDQNPVKWTQDNFFIKGGHFND